LLVTADKNLQILNRGFRDQLTKRFGRDYQKELKEAKRPTSKTPVVISGVHIPTRDIRPSEGLSTYQGVITSRLEAGIRSAAEQGSRRAVICNNAIWPEDWRDAERIIHAVEKHMYQWAAEDEEPCEIVQVTLLKQAKEKKSEMLDNLRRLSSGQRKRDSPGACPKEAKPSTGEVVEVEDSCEKEKTRGSAQKVYYTKTGGSRDKPIALTEQQPQPKPRTAVPIKGAPKFTPVDPPASTARRGSSAPQQDLELGGERSPNQAPPPYGESSQKNPNQIRVQMVKTPCSHSPRKPRRV